MNLLLYPEAVKFKRRHPLDPKQFQYLEGCVRKEKPYKVPPFADEQRQAAALCLASARSAPATSIC